MMTFEKFVSSIDETTKDIKCVKIEYQGFNCYEGTRYTLTIKQTLINGYSFSKSGRPTRIIKVSINSNYLDDNTIPYIEMIFINAYFRKYLLDNFM